MKTELKERGLTAYIQTITPSIAKKMLETIANPKNRKVSDANVTNYGRMMRENKWLVNGEAIVIQQDGLIANGHNRLHAVVRAGVPVDFLIVEGVSCDAFATFDAGQKRTAAHVLQMSDVPNAKNISSAISSLIIYREAISRNGSFNTYVRPTNQEILDEYNNHPALYQSSIKLAMKSKTICPVQHCGMLYCYTLVDKKHDFEEVEQFATALITGANLPESSPILTLRRSLERAKYHRQTSGSNKSQNWYKNAIIIAWNAYIEGRDLRKLKVMDLNKATKIK